MFATVDLEALTPDRLQEELAAQAAHVDAGLARLMELVGECERRVSWAGENVTFARWLAWRCSLLPRQAREHGRVAAALRELPLIRGAFERGELSYGKVSLLTRVAERESEERLIELAGAMTASQLERAVGAYRRLTRADAGEQLERAFLDWFWTEDGSFSFRGRLPAEEGALVLSALEAGRTALRERRRAEAPEAEVPAHERPHECRVSNADALVAACDLALSKPDGDRSGGERSQVVVHVDAATLAADADGRCELADGPAVAAETARRLTCDGAVVQLHEHAGEPLSLGRKRRTVSPPLRRALIARDRGCRFPGCEATRFVDAHHVRHWSHGGETSLDNLLTLCRRHHKLAHEGGYTVERSTGDEVRWKNRHGVAIPNVHRPPGSDGRALHRRHGALDLDIDARTGKNGHGDRMDLSLAVDAIFAAAARPP